MDLNKVMIIGRLTRDPESRTTPQGTAVANFSVATSRVWKDQQGQQQEQTEFHDVVAWRRLAEICTQYLGKGRQVYIEGHLQTRSWDDQNTGQKRYRTEIIANSMIMLGSKSDTAGAPQQQNQYQQQPQQQQQQPQEQSAPPQQQQQEMDTSAPASDEEIRIEDIPF